MKTTMLAMLLAVPMFAAVPECSTKNIEGHNFEICMRQDATCAPSVEKFLKEGNDSWSKNWHGCTGRVYINNFLLIAPPIMAGWSFSISLPASYDDSERMDIIVRFELSDHTLKAYEWRDVAIVSDADSHIHSARVQFLTEKLIIGVPTAESTEKGGARQFSHSYK
jgi:hypothetical protein